MSQMLIYAFAMGAGVFLPLLLARVAVGAGWLAITIASVSWIAFLYLWLANGWRYEREAAMWTLGFALISNWIAIPGISLFLKAILRVSAGRGGMPKSARHRDEMSEEIITLTSGVHKSRGDILELTGDRLIIIGAARRESFYSDISEVKLEEGSLAAFGKPSVIQLCLIIRFSKNPKVQSNLVSMPASSYLEELISFDAGRRDEVCEFIAMIEERRAKSRA